MDYKKELNPEQYEAVTTKDGAVLILAGAGSGKTRVITYRIAYLVEHYGVNPQNILAITFTNKAAREMLERVEKMLPNDAKGMWISTFHAFCGRILRSYADSIGFTSNFVVLDDDDTIKTIKLCLKNRNLDPKNFNPNELRSRISSLKNEMISPEKFQMMMNKNNPSDRVLLNIYNDYEKYNHDNNAMDFDDMLLNAVKLLKENDHAREVYTNRFKYIMVDEYQDTNMVQYALISLLASHGNLCVVGDDDQSIYSFRGADIKNILNFEKQFPNCKVIKLEQNYRSTECILGAANGVIANNKSSRKEKKLWTAEKGGEKVLRFVGETQFDEGSFIAQEIGRLVETGEYDFKDFAVLYRQNAMSQNLESSFTRMRVPFRVYGGLKFFARSEIKLMINYLRLFDNPNNVAALREVINVPKRAIGDKGVEIVMQISEQEGTPVMKVVTNANKYPALARYAEAMKDFSRLFYGLLLERDEMTISDFVEHIENELGIIKMYQESPDEKEQARVENLKELITVAKDYEKTALEDPDMECSFSGFLENISLSTDMDNTDEESENKVTLMTIHASKGLEYPVVFVSGMEQELFPSRRAIEDNQVDEERRLCYVAMTRARERLYLINVNERMLYGKTNRNLESAFLSEIPSEFVKFVDYFGRETAKPVKKSFASFGNEYSSNNYLSYGNSENEGYGKRYSSYGGNYGRRPSYSAGGSYGDTAEKVKPKGPFQSVGSNSSVKTNFSVSNIDNTNDRLEKARQAASSGDTNFSVGDRVKHQKFGVGTISTIEGEKIGDKDDRICEIIFDTVGMKRFAMQYTKLSKI